jgi:kynurenine formamidase
VRFSGALLCLSICAGSAAQDFSVVDLTHTLQTDMALWPGVEPFRMERLVDYEKGYRLHRFSLGENVGTHVDAPSHFIPGGRGIDALAPEELVAPLVVVEVSTQAEGDPDHAATPADFEAWEARHGRIPAGAFVALNSGWHHRFADPDRYLNRDADGVMHFPGFSPAGAELLLERGVAGIGIDTLSVDPGSSKDFAVHKLVLSAGLYQVENLANLGRVPARGAMIVVGVLPVRNGSQSPARIYALLPATP